MTVRFETLTARPVPPATCRPATPRCIPHSAVTAVKRGRRPMWRASAAQEARVMTTILLIVTRLAWEFLEGGLLLRDRALGKGSTEQDRGTRRLAAGLGVVAIAGRQCVLGFFFVNPR